MNGDHRKTELKSAWKEEQRQKLLSSIPIPHQDLLDLFDQLERSGFACNHTLSETKAFLQGRNLASEKVYAWLRENGGYCDCEVLANVDDKYGELLGK